MTLKVAATSEPKSVAGALAAEIRKSGRTELLAVGAQAVNQAVKAIAIARGFVAPYGQNLTCIPAFTDLDADGKQITAIRIIVCAQ